MFFRCLPSADKPGDIRCETKSSDDPLATNDPNTTRWAELAQDLGVLVMTWPKEHRDILDEVSRLSREMLSLRMQGGGAVYMRGEVQAFENKMADLKTECRSLMTTYP